MSADDDRFRHLQEAKLRSIVRAHRGATAGADDLPAEPFAGGAAVRDGADLWVLATTEPARALGRALLLLARTEHGSLHLVLDAPEHAPALARRAAALTRPVDVFTLDGPTLVPAVADPLPTPPDPPEGPATAALVAMLHEGGVDVVVEHGVISGEVHGLEVARVRIDAAGHSVLDVGIGRFDQEAGALLHADTPTPQALADAAGMIRELRRPDASPHPVNRLARERWLRAQVIAAPGLVGATSLSPISPPLPRPNVKDPWPAAAIGATPEGEVVLVVCTVGVDLEWVPVTADLVERERPDHVVVVLPPRDLLPAQRRLAALLPVAVTFVALDGAWPT